MKHTAIYYIVGVVVVVLGTLAIISFGQQERPITEPVVGQSIQTSPATSTVSSKVFSDDHYGIEFQYPASVEIRGSGPNWKVPERHQLVDFTYYFDGLNSNAKLFSLNIASTTATDITKLHYDYKTLWTMTNPKIESREVITVAGRPALKQVVNDGDKQFPSTLTWIHVINNGMLYSVRAGINHGYDNTTHKGTPSDEKRVQQCLDMFLSTLKFF